MPSLPVRRTPKHQRGAALILLTAVILAVGFGFVLLQAVELARSRANSWQQLQLQRVDEASALIRQYYLQNAACIDAVNPAYTCTVPTSSNVMALALVPTDWNLVAYVSGVITRGPVNYHTIAVLAPAESGAQVPTFSATTGVLTLCPDTSATCVPRASSLVDGYAIESDLYARTVKLLNDFALSAQAYFNAKYLGNPDHNTGINWFRAPYGTTADPCAVSAADIPCIDGWTAISSLNAAQAIALIEQPDEDPTAIADCISNGTCPFADAWGNPLYLANGNDSNSVPFGTPYTSPSPPFRLAIEAVTPWNTSIEIFAVQAL